MAKVMDECETAFEAKAAQLRPRCKHIGGLRIAINAHLAEQHSANTRRQKLI